MLSLHLSVHSDGNHTGSVGFCDLLTLTRVCFQYSGCLLEYLHLLTYLVDPSFIKNQSLSFAFLHKFHRNFNSFGLVFLLDVVHCMFFVVFSHPVRFSLSTLPPPLLWLSICLFLSPPACSFFSP